MYLDNVKAKLTIEDNIIKGYAIVFDSVDLQNEYFTKSTFLGVEENSKTILMYNHGLDETLKRVPIGITTKYAIDDYGLSFEAEIKSINPNLWKDLQIEDNQKYLDAIKDLVKSGKLGVSSGAVGHSVIKSNNEIKQWLIGELSLTPTPAEPKTFIKSEIDNNVTIETNLNTQIEAKAGRVLSQKNYDRLKSIKAIIDEIDSEIESKLEAMQEKEKLQSGMKPETKNENYFDVKELEVEINNIIKGALYGAK
jgi:phage head maturation protease